MNSIGFVCTIIIKEVINQRGKEEVKGDVAQNTIFMYEMLKRIKILN